MNSLPADRKVLLGRWQWGSLGVGIVALAITIIGGIFTPDQFFRTYLVAYLYFLGIAHGCFVVLMIYHLTGGAWGFLLRRILEAGMRTLPLLALLFLPIAFGVHYLYPWAQPEGVAILKESQQKYLTVPGFCVRAALCFLLWIGIALCLSRWSRQQDQADDPVVAERLARRQELLSAIGLVVFGITITFAAVDWIMSLQPAFRSTIIGPLFASSEILAGFACAILVMTWLLSRPPLAEMVSLEALNDIGNLLLTFVVLWAYMEFFQFMLIWIANLRYDILWYLPRTRDGWQVVAWVLFLFNFAVPFFLLLMRPIKQNPRSLAMLAGLILVMNLLYRYYVILPAFTESRLWVHWLDVVAPFGVGGLWLANFLWDLKQGPVLPSHDANQDAALRYHQLDEESRAQREELSHA